jgi:DNA primase
VARFAPDTVERVKDAADMVEIVSAYTDLRRKGERYEGLCPFHEERTPSFSVDPHQKLYHCFGCQVGGDVFQFVQEKEGLSFPEAVERLGERYGVEVEREREDPRAEEARRRRERLGELLERTAAFYVSFLWESEKAAKAREYLAGRGLGEQVLREFGVGFAPSAWDQVLTRGQRAGYSVEEMRAAGLVQKGQKGGFYDRFRKRIVFPVRDPRGRVVGFGARSLGEGAKGPKYLNSPEGVFRKSEMLFGIDRARQAIARGGRAVVVEGYTDVLALHQAGISDSVAVMGTAITPDQLKSLSRYTEEVVLAMDADRAGEDAMIRAQRVAGARRMRLRVAEMPQGKDPADMVGDGSPERMSELVSGAVDLPVFQVHAALDRAELGTGAGRDRALDEVAPVLVALDADSVSRQELVRTVADRLDTDAGLVTRRIEREGKGRGRAAPARWEGDTPAPSKRLPPRELSARERRERTLIAMCIRQPADGAEFLARLTPEHTSSPLAARAVEWIRGHLDNPRSGLPRDNADLVSLVTDLVVRSDREPASRDAMELNFLWLEQAMLEDQIAAAQRNGGDPPVELQRRRADVAQRIAHWETDPSG